MCLADVDISGYEGLVYSTAARYAPMLDEDLEDVQQILLLKVAQALDAFDPKRTKLGVKSYVFSCVRNQIKDLLKSQARRSEVRNGALLHIEDFMAENDRSRPLTAAFEARYLSASEEEVYAEAENESVALPSTLTEFERCVVHLLMLDLTHREIAKQLGVARNRIASAHHEVQRKMLDWKPTGGDSVDLPTPVAA